MSFLDFDHIELYVEELEPAALFYVSTFGFRVVAEAGPADGPPAGARCCCSRAGRGCGSPRR